MMSDKALLLLIFASAFMAGCTTNRQADVHSIENSGHAHYVRNVPFVRQQRNFCGPSAIVVVERFFGRDVDQQEIADQVFAKSIRATLTLDIDLYAKRENHWSQAINSVSEIKDWLRRDVPVIALLQVGPPLARLYHFLVLIGFDDASGHFITHDGYLPNRLLSYRKFTRQWKRAHGWAIVMVPPERVVWPLSANGFNELGLRFEAHEKLDKALDAYGKAISKQPDEAVYHFNRANVLFQRDGVRDPTVILSSYRRALEIDPLLHQARNNLAYVLMLSGDLDTALEEALKTTRAEAKRYDYWETLAEIREARNESGEAIQAWTNALRLLKAGDSRRKALMERITKLRG